MMNILKVFYSILESIGKARAATYLTRQGRIDEARKIMQD